MSVLGSSTQVAPGVSLFAASAPVGVGTLLNSPVFVNTAIAPNGSGISQAYIAPNATGTAPNEGALHLGSSAQNTSLLLMRDRSPTAGGVASVRLSSTASNPASPSVEVWSTGGGATPATTYIQAAQAGVTARGQTNLVLGTDTYPNSVVINDDPVSVGAGSGLTLNTNVFLAPSGAAGLAFDINGYDNYVGAEVAVASNTETVIPNPAGLTPGLYAITTGSISATRLPFSTVALYDTANGWRGCCAYAPGAPPSGGAGAFPNAVLQKSAGSNNLSVFDFTGLGGRTVQLCYIRLTGNGFNIPNI